jgi:hypothetical protein
MLVGCNRPAETTTVPLSVSRFDSAIENLSITTEQLESVRREKDLFVNVLENLEEQKTEYAAFLDSQRLRSQMQDFAVWHRDISQRERQLEIRHALNVFAAHSQVEKRKFADPNQTMLANPPPPKP